MSTRKRKLGNERDALLRTLSALNTKPPRGCVSNEDLVHAVVRACSKSQFDPVSVLADPHGFVEFRERPDPGKGCPLKPDDRHLAAFLAASFDSGNRDVHIMLFGRPWFRTKFSPLIVFRFDGLSQAQESELLQPTAPSSGLVDREGLDDGAFYEIAVAHDQRILLTILEDTLPVKDVANIVFQYARFDCDRYQAAYEVISRPPPTWLHMFGRMEDIPGSESESSHTEESESSSHTEESDSEASP